MKKQLILYAFLVLIITTGRAEAVLYSFECITENIAGDCAIGEAQLNVDVTDAGSGLVMFSFINNGPEASSITDVYFDDQVPYLNYGSGIINSSAGVSFSEGASPSHLPDYTPTAFQQYSADSDSPVASNGVNPGESLDISFDLFGGYDFDDVISAINLGDLKIGIHVQAFDSGGSESFIITPIPEPITMLLFGTGLAGLAGISRRRKK